MNVEEVITDYLKKNGYDGLHSNMCGCGCLLGDLAPGCRDIEICELGYKIKCNAEKRAKHECSEESPCCGPKNANCPEDIE